MLVMSSGMAAQQVFWHEVADPVDRSDLERRIVPAQYRVVALDVPALAGVLDMLDLQGEGTVVIPGADGGNERFTVRPSNVMHPELQTNFPEIRAYVGESVDRPGVLGRFDLTPHGFHAMLLDPFGSDLFIDPYAFGQDELHIVYRKGYFSKQLPPDHVFCAYEEVNDLEAERVRSLEWMAAMGDQRAGDCQLRTYRLALACTGEYANFHGSNTSNNNKSFAMAAMVTTMNRVNGIYERDAAITMVIVPNNQDLIYLNPSTDPYTNNNGSTMLGQNQTTCNSVIGSANYDIGHVFSTGGGGIAQLNSPCTSNKARGVTGLPNPVGDPFDVDYVAHEMGHQYGGNHTQYNDGCNRANSAAFEPGSASTIMGYAGVCSPSIQNNSDALFLGYSLQEIAANVVSGNSSSCPQVTASGSSAPVVQVLTNRTIPRSTPFVLTAVASDVDPGTQLTYAWEQMNNQLNNGNAYPQPPQATNAGGPNFRAFLPSTDPSRWFPNLAAVVANTTPTWEVLPSVARTLNFRVTVRDNNAGAGCTSERNMTVTVNAASGPFVVTAPNTNVSWQAGSQQTVTWDVAGTTSSPVSCANVDILLSVDGGFTYPHVLLTSTPNDGTQQVTLPVIPATTTARIMVRANANIFYDISNTNFTVTAAPAQPSLRAKIYLDGAYDAVTGLMWDSLRVDGLVPLTEPYTALGFPALGGGGESTTPAVLALTGNNAVVDWVRVELRSQAAPATVVAARHGLLQRDGDIVAGDGTSPLQFNVAAGQYHVAVRHRNHLGCMTSAAPTLSGTPVDVDLRVAATATYGTDARKSIGSARLLWAGNVVRDNRILYTNQANDRDPILQEVGGIVPTNSVGGYRQTDVNLDGTTRYTGERNDRDIILQNIGGVVPTSSRIEQLP